MAWSAATAGRSQVLRICRCPQHSSDNYALGQHSGGGGAIASFDALAVSDAQILGNYTQGERDGGGALETFGPSVITASTLAGNHADNGAGGGAVQSFAPLTVSASTFTDNESNAPAPDPKADPPTTGGGAIQSFSPLSITGSTLSGNRSNAESGGTSGGGAIESFDALNLATTTLSGNQADSGGSSESFGGAIRVFGQVDCGQHVFRQPRHSAGSSTSAAARSTTLRNSVDEHDARRKHCQNSGGPAANSTGLAIRTKVAQCRRVGEHRQQHSANNAAAAAAPSTTELGASVTLHASILALSGAGHYCGGPVPHRPRYNLDHDGVAASSAARTLLPTRPPGSAAGLADNCGPT